MLGLCVHDRAAQAFMGSFAQFSATAYGGQAAAHKSDAVHAVPASLNAPGRHGQARPPRAEANAIRCADRQSGTHEHAVGVQLHWRVRSSIRFKMPRQDAYEAEYGRSSGLATTNLGTAASSVRV